MDITDIAKRRHGIDPLLACAVEGVYYSLLEAAVKQCGEEYGLEYVPAPEGGIIVREKPASTLLQLFAYPPAEETVATIVSDSPLGMPGISDGSEPDRAYGGINIVVENILYHKAITNVAHVMSIILQEEVNVDGNPVR